MKRKACCFAEFYHRKNETNQNKTTQHKNPWYCSAEYIETYTGVYYIFLFAIYSVLNGDYRLYFKAVRPLCERTGRVAMCQYLEPERYKAETEAVILWLWSDQESPHGALLHVSIRLFLIIVAFIICA